MAAQCSPLFLAPLLIERTNARRGGRGGQLRGESYRRSGATDGNDDGSDDQKKTPNRWSHRRNHAAGRSERPRVGGRGERERERERDVTFINRQFSLSGPRSLDFLAKAAPSATDTFFFSFPGWHLASLQLPTLALSRSFPPSFSDYTQTLVGRRGRGKGQQGGGDPMISPRL